MTQPTVSVVIVNWNGLRRHRRLDRRGDGNDLRRRRPLLAECVGIHAARRGTGFEALEPLRRGIREHFGAYHAKVAAGLALRHDYGSPFMSDLFQAERRFLGITSSPAGIREPEGNGCAERSVLERTESPVRTSHRPGEQRLLIWPN